MSLCKVIDVWNYHCEADAMETILPDGCRDLILVYPLDDKPFCYWSDLATKTENAKLNKGSRLIGFRMKPGTIISSESVSVFEDYFDSPELLLNELELTCQTHTNLDEVLTGIQLGEVVSNKIGVNLGVSKRTVERMVKSQTKQPLSYWVRLHRVRKAASLLLTSKPAAQVAYELGFSDQSHLCREFSRWFSVSPLQFVQRPDLVSQLKQPSF